MCGKCQSTDWESIETSGRGTVHSYTILEYPPIPGYDFPLPVVLVDLEEGTRMIANIIDCPIEDIRIGMQVECRFEMTEGDINLPFFYPAK
jgi:hypothetical protein